MAGLKFHTDFEDIYSESATRISFPPSIQNYFNLEYASKWIEGLERSNLSVSGLYPLPSGARCLGMETQPIVGSETVHRMEFNMNLAPLGITQELYVRYKLFFPNNFAVPVGNWITTCGPLGGALAADDWLPCSETGFDTWDGIVKFRQQFGTGASKYYLARFPYTIPTGRWVDFAFYVYFDVALGKVKVWLDGALMCDASNLATLYYVGQPMMMNTNKIYHPADGSYHQSWVDDLEIWDGIPSYVKYTFSQWQDGDTSNPKSVLV